MPIQLGGCVTQFNTTGTGGYCTLGTSFWNSGYCDCACPMAFQFNSSGTWCDHSFSLLSRYIDFPALTSSKSIHVVRDFGSICGNTLGIVACDGSTATELHVDVLCKVGSLAFDLTVPAGTNRLYIFLYGGCNAPQATSDLCNLTITCN